MHRHITTTYKSTADIIRERPRIDPALAVPYWSAEEPMSAPWGLRGHGDTPQAATLALLANLACDATSADLGCIPLMLPSEWELARYRAHKSARYDRYRPATTYRIGHDYWEVWDGWQLGTGITMEAATRHYLQAVNRDAGRM